MFVGTCRLELFWPGLTSLKDKRRQVQSLCARLARAFGVAVAEVGHLEHHQRASLGVACVSNSPGHCRQVLDAVVLLAGRDAELEVADLEVHGDEGSGRG